MGLDALRGADHQHRGIHHADGPLRFPGKVSMPGRIHQRQVRFPPGQPRLLGEDGDPAFLFHLLRIQESVSVIYPALPAHGAAEKQHGFGQSGFARVHMGRQTHRQLSRHGCFPPFYSLPDGLWIQVLMA